MSKYFCLLLLFSSISSLAATLPQSWTEDIESPESHSEVSQVSDVQSVLSEILKTQSEALEESTLSEGDFGLSHYSTGFSVSKSGRLGLSSLNAKKSVDVYWKRKEVLSTELSQTISLTAMSNRKSMSPQIGQVIDLISNINSGIDLFSLAKNLKSYFANMNKLFEQVSTNQWNNWSFDGLRTDLFIGVDGTVSQVFVAGVAVKLRIEWQYKKENFTKNKKTSLSRLITNLLKDIDYALSKEQNTDFDLNKVYIGVGHSSSLDLFGLANTSKSLMGYARFIRASKDKVTNHASIEEQGDYELLSKNKLKNNQKGIGKLFRIKRSKWRKGLVKALQMSNTFVETCDTQSPNWEIFKVKSSFEVNYRGWLGFSSNSTDAVVEFDFLKHNTDYVDTSNRTQNQFDSGPKWFMELIKLSVRLEAGFKIPFLVNTIIYPEVEFYWIR